jgi:hypothetical protein
MIDAFNLLGWLIFIDVAVEHPLTSVTVKLYVPAVRVKLPAPV